MDLIRSLTWLSSSHLRLVRDDDSHADRLSHRYTVGICIVFAIIVTTKQYAGDPIGKINASFMLLALFHYIQNWILILLILNQIKKDCWVPAQFKASYEKYADSYCWIAGMQSN